MSMLYEFKWVGCQNVNHLKHSSSYQILVSKPDGGGKSLVNNYAKLSIQPWRSCNKRKVLWIEVPNVVFPVSSVQNKNNFSYIF